MIAVTYPHLTVDQSGVATITGTTTKVVEIALDRIAHHWDADEIQRQHPYLTLSQIYTALAYYYDHQTELDALIEGQLDRVADLRTQTENLELRRKLLASKASLQGVLTVQTNAQAVPTTN